MNVLFISAWHPEPQDNGSKLRVYHLLAALAEKHSVTLCSFAWGGALPLRKAQLEALGIRVHALEIDPFAANAVAPLRTFVSPARGLPGLFPPWPSWPATWPPVSGLTR